MTTPQPPQPTDLQQTSWQRDAVLAALTAAASYWVASGVLARIRSALHSMTSAWVVTVGPVHTTGVPGHLVRPVVMLGHALMDEVADEVPAAIARVPDAVQAAWVSGYRHAGGARPTLEQQRQHAGRPLNIDMPAVLHRQLMSPAAVAAPSPERLINERERARIVAAVVHQIEQAKALLTEDKVSAEGFKAVQVALAAAEQVERRVEDAVAWHMLNAEQEAVADVARQRDMALIWVPERDACVVCQALAGEVVDPGQSFDVTATYGRESALPAVWPKADYLPHPPRHNRCRCRCELHSREDTGVVMALKREARRAIVYGYRTDGQSSSERRDAADRLLAKGARLPKTVEARARRLVANPEPFGGPVPDFTT